MNLAEQLQQLYAQYGDIPGITIELHKELIAIAIKNKHASATVFLQGAQISQYQRHQQATTLWLSPECDYKQGQALRGGIPICWPWFGDINRNPEIIKQQYNDLPVLPAHGLVRDVDWQLDNITSLDDGSNQLKLSLDLSPNDQTVWPYESHLSCTITIGPQLHIEFTVRNTDEQSFSYSSALHSYLAVDGIEGVSIIGLDGSEFIDGLDDWQSKTQQGPVTIDGEVDRIYQTNHSTITVNDKGYNRDISLNSQGSNSCVIWNPWIEKSKRLSCFDDLAYQEMLCIETANVLDDIITLAPQQDHTLALTIR